MIYSSTSYLYDIYMPIIKKNNSIQSNANTKYTFYDVIKHAHAYMELEPSIML